MHRAIVVDPTRADLPVQPPYIWRRHDEELARVVAQAAGGRSVMAVLVGGPSTGKTRACWEAVHQLPPGWRLWQPPDSTRPEAVLARLPRIEPRTVVWLNETQLYLDTPDDTGERVAAALRTLLTASRQVPVRVLGTLWPAHWSSLTRDGAPHGQARAVLADTNVRVPAVFTGPALQDLQRAAAVDPRLQRAAAAARDGQVSQYLAGVPELLARYRQAPPAVTALIHAAMDARRLGHRSSLPLAFLEAAAPAYLSDPEWDALGEDWLEQALAYTAEPIKGVAGPLTRVHPRPVRSGAPDGDSQRAEASVGLSGGPVYRLADYLDQHGRYQRKSNFPPAGFWAAAAAHTFPGDQAALGDAAHARGLYRDAAQLHKNAAAHGNHRAVSYLIKPPDYLRADVGPIRWAAAHTTLDDPAGVAGLLVRLPGVGADEQVAALLRSDPAARVSLRDPFAVAGLLVRLLKVGAHEQVAALADRAAADTSLDDPVAVAALLDGLRGVGLPEQVAALADRAAADTSLDDPLAVAGLLDGLRAVGAYEQVAALAGRAAAHVSLRDPFALAGLLDRLRGVGLPEQVAALADRAAADVSLGDPLAVAGLLDGLRGVGALGPVSALAARAAADVLLDDPAAVAELLDRLVEVGALEQVGALLRRDPAAHVSLDRPAAVAWLLDGLSGLGALEQVSALADRSAAQVSLQAPFAVAQLLDRLGEVGAPGQVSVLADRAAADVALDDPAAVAGLLDRLGEAGAKKQFTTLVDRLPAEGMFDLFQHVAGTRSQFGREPDGRPAEPWGWAGLR